MANGLMRPRVVVTAIVVLVIDQVTKIWAVERLDRQIIDVVWTLRFRLIRNTGSSFGIGQQFGRVLAIVVVLVIIGALFWGRRMTDKRVLVLLGLIVGGAVGNLVDRVLRADDGVLSGGVIDFIDLQWWPIFNVADMAVVVGAFALGALSMIDPMSVSPQLGHGSPKGAPIPADETGDISGTETDAYDLDFSIDTGAGSDAASTDTSPHGEGP